VVQAVILEEFENRQKSSKGTTFSDSFHPLKEITFPVLLERILGTECWVTGLCFMTTRQRVVISGHSDTAVDNDNSHQ
jgi:hypothetical protein